MNLIVEENVDKLVVNALRQDGHNVLCTLPNCAAQ